MQGIIILATDWGYEIARDIPHIPAYKNEK